MSPSLGHVSRVLLSGLLTGSFILCLTTASPAQSSKAKPKKAEVTPQTAVFSNSSPSPSPGKGSDGQAMKKGQYDEKLWNGMQWREVGPFRGGRAVAIEGVPDEPNTYYFGGVAGGVWKQKK